jgi:hypothetical protein
MTSASSPPRSSKPMSRVRPDLIPAAVADANAGQFIVSPFASPCP